MGWFRRSPKPKADYKHIRQLELGFRDVDEKDAREYVERMMSQVRYFDWDGPDSLNDIIESLREEPWLVYG